MLTTTRAVVLIRKAGLDRGSVLSLLLLLLTTLILQQLAEVFYKYPVKLVDRVGQIFNNVLIISPFHQLLRGAVAKLQLSLQSILFLFCQFLLHAF